MTPVIVIKWTSFFFFFYSLDLERVDDKWLCGSRKKKSQNGVFLLVRGEKRLTTHVTTIWPTNAGRDGFTGGQVVGAQTDKKGPLLMDGQLLVWGVTVLNGLAYFGNQMEWSLIGIETYFCGILMMGRFFKILCSEDFFF